MLQFSIPLRNARAAQFLAVIGPDPLLKLYSDSEPADCAAVAPPGLLATLTLPATWLGSPSEGVVSLAGTWEGTASAAGRAASWRLYDSTGTTCHKQGTVSAPGADPLGDLVLINPALTIGEPISVTNFALTEANA